MTYSEYKKALNMLSGVSIPTDMMDYVLPLWEDQVSFSPLMINLKKIQSEILDSLAEDIYGKDKGGNKDVKAETQNQN